MSVEKSELKMAVIESLGIKADDRLEALQADFHRAEGAVIALEELAKKIETDVFARFKKDVDEGTLPGDPAQAAHKHLMTCLHYVQHLAKNTGTKLPIWQGKIQEAQENVNRLKAEYNEEKLKVTAVQQAQEEGVARVAEDGAVEMAPQEGRHPERRPLGVRPAPSLKAQRLAQPEPPSVSAVPIRKRSAAKGKARAENT